VPEEADVPWVWSDEHVNKPSEVVLSALYECAHVDQFSYREPCLLELPNDPFSVDIQLTFQKRTPDGWKAYDLVIACIDVGGWWQVVVPEGSEWEGPGAAVKSEMAIQDAVDKRHAEARSPFDWCASCYRTYRRGEYRIVNHRRCCPYEDCPGTLSWADDWAKVREYHTWADARAFAPFDFPEVPVTGRRYPVENVIIMRMATAAYYLKPSATGDGSPK
jgi:hypothetical protein